MTQTSERPSGLIRRTGIAMLAIPAALLILYTSAAHIQHAVVRAQPPRQLTWLLIDVVLVIAPLLIPALILSRRRRDSQTRDAAMATALAVSCILSLVSFVLAIFWI